VVVTRFQWCPEGLPDEGADQEQVHRSGPGVEASQVAHGDGEAVGGTGVGTALGPAPEAG